MTHLNPHPYYTTRLEALVAKKAGVICASNNNSYNKDRQFGATVRNERDCRSDQCMRRDQGGGVSTVRG